MAKKKKKPNAKSLENLKLANPANNFNNSEVARAAQKKSVEARKANQTMRQVAEEKLLELMSNGMTFQENAFERLKQALFNNKTKPADLVKILEFLRDTSGQKPVEKHDLVNDFEDTRRAYLEAMKSLNADKVGEQQIQQQSQSVSGETA